MGINFQNLYKKSISLQNKAFRLIANNFDFKLHVTSSLHKQLSMLKLSDIHKHEVASFMYKFSNMSTSQTLTNYFVQTDLIHSSESRQQTDGNFCIHVTELLDCNALLNIAELKYGTPSCLKLTKVCLSEFFLKDTNNY